MSQLTDNEVLADFIGKRLEKPSKGYDQQWELPMCDGYYPSVKTLEFDKRWERLMPVWYKFRDLKFEDYDDTTAFLNHKIRIVAAIINEGPTPAEACRLLAYAIRWYQQINQSVKQ